MVGATLVDTSDAKDAQYLSDESSDLDVVNHQIELEKGNEIQFRTCSWQKVVGMSIVRSQVSYRSCLDSSITLFRVHMSRDYVLPVFIFRAGNGSWCPCNYWGRCNGPVYIARSLAFLPSTPADPKRL